MEASAGSVNTTLKKKHVFNAQNYLASSGAARRVLEYRKFEKAYSQGDPATNVLYIQKGEVKISVINVVGKEVVLAMLGPGNFFGEGCLAGQLVRMATATTTAPTRLLAIEKNELIRVLHTERAFSDRFVSYMLERNIRIEQDLVDQLFNSSEKRLARTLLLLGRCGMQEESRKLLPKVSQETLAEMIGSTRSRVCFFMNKFKKLGFIEYKGGLYVKPSLLSVVLRE
jgi:CRP/FNR family transcriptional regulator, cyclic AMP receptor protein